MGTKQLTFPSLSRSREIEGCCGLLIRRRLITVGAILACFHAVACAECDDEGPQLERKSFAELKRTAVTDGMASEILDKIASTPSGKKELISLILGKRKQLGDTLKSIALPSNLGKSSFGEFTASLQFLTPQKVAFRGKLCAYFDYYAAEPARYRAFDQPEELFADDDNFKLMEDILGLLEHSANTAFSGCAPDHPYDTTDGKRQECDSVDKLSKLAGWYISSMHALGKLIYNYRDMVYLFKLGGTATQRSGSVFKLGNHVIPAKLYDPSDLKLKFEFKLMDDGAKIELQVECVVKKLTAPQSPHSAARPQTYANGCTTEDDLLHAPNLPSFGDKVEAEAAERLLSFLTVPYMRIPLVCAWFADSRIGCLFNEDMRDLLDAVLFEAGRYAGDDAKPTTSVPQPPRTLGCGSGLLLNELLHAPSTVVQPLLSLLDNAVSLCIGGHRSAFVQLFLHLFRVVCRVEAYILYAQMLCSDASPAGVGSWASATVATTLTSCATQVKDVIHTKALPVVLKWRDAAEKSGDKLISARMHAHVLLMHRNDKPSVETVGTFLGSAGYLLSYHTAGVGAATDSSTTSDDNEAENDAESDQSAIDLDLSANSLLLPDSLLFEALQSQRDALSTWFNCADKPSQTQALNIFLRLATVSPDFNSPGFDRVGPGISEALRVKESTTWEVGASHSAESIPEEAVLQALLECGLNQRAARSLIKRDLDGLMERYDSARRTSPLFAWGSCKS